MEAHVTAADKHLPHRIPEHTRTHRHWFGLLKRLARARNFNSTLVDLSKLSMLFVHEKER
jgi:hypothetical protein